MKQPSRAPVDGAKFDAYAEDYVAIHQRNIAMSGESPAYFAAYKRGCLERLVEPTFDQPVLDYGCGVGMVTEQLCARFSEVHGFDPSEQSVSAARVRAPRASFHTNLADVPEGRFGLVVISGVLHHVAPSEREAVLRRAIRKLRPGDGRVVVFEHNPLNPLTRRAVASCPFDDDAIMLGPWEGRRLLRRAGLRDVTLRFIVFLPRALAAFRWLEPRLGRVPLGAQVMLVGRSSA
ncbi:MAG: class I SAM-dependent methyltransferase [Myxococcota bacterium]|nr:class I SAM-dependent methyltransferase [Myxococcota bacterium]